MPKSIDTEGPGSIDLNIKVHYFRKFRTGSDDGQDTHGTLPGTHGNNHKYCKACVVAIMAVIYNPHGRPVDCSMDINDVYVGVAFRNPLDQFNRKIGRSIAIGIAKKNLEYNEPCDPIKLAEAIASCYDNPTQDIKAALSKIRPYPKALERV